MNSVEAFAFYEQVRHRLPQAPFPASSRVANDIVELSDHIDTFVFDAFGVLNVGDKPVEGAKLQIDRLRELGKKIYVLTNGASNHHQGSMEKFHKLGFEFDTSEIISSRAAAEQALSAKPASWHWGVAARKDFQSSDLAVQCAPLLDDSKAYDAADAFLLLSSADWTDHRQELLHRSLESKERPLVVANPDVVAPFVDGFSLEPGYFAHNLADSLSLEPEFHGKPFPSVFELLEKSLSGEQMASATHPLDRSRIAMVGDTLHTDVLGACARGWVSVLVTDHGLFRGMQVQDFIKASEMTPHWIIPTL